MSLDTPFTLERRFNAPLARVWQAWTDPRELQQWWGPKGCTLEVLGLEFRPGGFFHYAMAFPGVPRSYGRFNYREIVEGERIVWLNSFANEHGGIARAPFSADCPMEIENSAGFAEEGGVTTLSLRARPFGALASERQFFSDLGPSLAQGYGGTMDQLAAFLG